MKISFSEVFKANPYHDETGAFTSEDKVSRARLKKYLGA